MAEASAGRETNEDPSRDTAGPEAREGGAPSRRQLAAIACQGTMPIPIPTPTPSMTTQAIHHPDPGPKDDEHGPSGLRPTHAAPRGLKMEGEGNAGSTDIPALWAYRRFGPMGLPAFRPYGPLDTGVEPRRGVTSVDPDTPNTSEGP
jgi:hypothetical protein